MKNIPRVFIARIQKKLLGWYHASKRDLPWRRTSDPYKIWLSEVMLQQTRVDTVVPYYERFLKTFPTITRLASAAEETVLKHWEGLGYYSRARNLQAAAKELVESYGGQLPATAEKLSTLKGFGPYTSRAVASIAFNEPVAVVDGNVKRVLSRLFATIEPVDAIAQQLISSKDPSSFNQAVMELGAMICLPRQPKCGSCPLMRECLAYKVGAIEKFPPKLSKTIVKKIYAYAVIPRKDERVLICQRPANGRWANMWEFPTIESPKPLGLSHALPMIQNVTGLRLSKPQARGQFTHQLTHRTMETEVFIAEAVGIPSRGEWISVTAIIERPFSRLQQRVLELAS